MAEKKKNEGSWKACTRISDGAEFEARQVVCPKGHPDGKGYTIGVAGEVAQVGDYVLRLQPGEHKAVSAADFAEAYKLS